MSTATSFLSPPAGVPYARPSTRRRIAHHRLVRSTEIRRRGRRFQLPEVASVPYESMNVDYLEEEFNGQVHGVTFEGIGDEFVAKLRLENGASAIVMLPSGLITSYKSPMWHGGSIEILHCSVSESEESGGVVVRGGVAPALALGLDCGGDRFDGPVSWALHNVRGNPRDSIQVELRSRVSEGMVELKYTVTLEEDLLTSEIIVCNNSKETSLQLEGCILSHLTVSTPEATYVIGLEGSEFKNRPPFSSFSAIVPPDYGQPQQGTASGLKGILLPGWGWGTTETREEEIEGEETDNYKHLMHRMSRIYTGAPRSFTIIDRGRRNSVVVGRDGFDELYMLSPGSNHVYYGEYSYICVAQSAILKPILLHPQQLWTGSQHLHNPNLY